jgi:RNA polymerase sigma factor (sigma-70 family)
LEATRRWPVDGVPANPGAWLTRVARNRALNRLRDQRRRGGPPLLLEDGLDGATTSDVTEHADLDGFGDDRLRLVVLCCHPSLPHDAQVALTLRLVGGLTAREIANAFVQREATVAQRISRAKRSLRARRARFELPPVAELRARLGAGRAAALPVLPLRRPARPRRRADPARRAGPTPLGPPPDPPGRRVPGRRPQRRRPWPPRRVLSAPGRDRRQARPRLHLRRHRLGRYPAAV